MTRIAIIGGGPAGIFCAICASENPKNEIFVFDKSIILNTILPTGGGRCNLANAQYNFKELAKNYPRGEKFLYSVFSKFSTADTIEFFEKIGVKTYTQEDNRIFPVSDSSKEVKTALLKELDKKKNVKKVFEEVVDIEKNDNGFVIKTKSLSKCHPELVSGSDKNLFDKVVIATGGKGIGQKLAKKLGHNVIDLKPALCSLITKEKDYTALSGMSLKNISAKVLFDKKSKPLTGDFLFTHKGISGPLVYKISSYCAYEEFNEQKPLKISFNLVNKTFEQFDEEFMNTLKKYSQKELGNVFSLFVPKNLALKILENEKIDYQTKAGQVKKADRTKLSRIVTDFVFNAVSVQKGEEVVTAGGVDLKEIDSKTMQSKLVEGLYFCGEVIDVDGLTGGFNLQNCWSTGFVAGTDLAI